MRNLLLFCLACICSQIVFSQDTATVQLLVQNEHTQAIEGEHILFEAQSGHYTTSAISNREGKAELSLLGGQTYNIIIKRIGETEKYNTLHIPALEPNEYYGVQQLTLTIYEPKQFTLQNVLFESGKSTLKNQAQTDLDNLVEYLQNKPSIHIQIIGHTDSVGNDEANLQLSKDRALAVKTYLVLKGIDSTRLETDGKGEMQPIASNETEAGKQKNRRTEIIIL